MLSCAGKLSDRAQPEICAVRRIGRRAEHWAIIASLIETCKLNDVDPLAYLTDVLTRIINGHPNSEIDQLIPWAYRPKDLKAVA